MKYHLTEGELNGPAETSAIDGLSTQLEVALPESYFEFLKAHDGGEGFVGDNYIVFWRAGELVDFNREYEVESYAPGIFLFGSSGGGGGVWIRHVGCGYAGSKDPVYRHGSSIRHLGGNRPSRFFQEIGRAR